MNSGTEFKIPIDNLYYMLCYSWNKLEEKDIVKVNAEENFELKELLAKVLSTGLKHLIKKGIDRNYYIHEEDSSLIRGKIRFAESIKRNLPQACKMQCSYDELTHNVLHNRIIKRTIFNLMKVISDRNIKNELREAHMHLFEVTDLALEKKHFGQVQLYRNNSFYKFLINICEIIFDNILIDSKTGEHIFRDFLRDEFKMRSLYEDFVRNFYAIELKEYFPKYSVWPEGIRWEGVSSDEASSIALPNMRTDVSIDYHTKEGGHKKIIMDTKYYTSAVVSRYEKDILHSNNLYQLFAYLKNTEYYNEACYNARGILLYPQVDKPHNYDYFIQGHWMSIRTINLNQKWTHIHRDLLSIVLEEIPESFAQISPAARLP